MDKYEYKVKLAQIEKLVAKKDFVTAAKIADGVDWRKVKSVTTLSMIADIYEATDRLEDCYEILNMVYDRSPVGRGVVYRLAEVATKMHDFEEAIDLYKEFVRIAPHDLSKYILKYQIYRERGSSVADQIVILEEFKSHEYNERWAYELACLYEEAGMIDRCIEECDELILWFSEGEYVVKAMELKMKHQSLTASQQEKYEHRFDRREEEPEEPEEYFDEDDEEEPEDDAQASRQPLQEKSDAPKEETDDTPQVSVINTNKFSTINLQEELARGLQQMFEQEAEEQQEEDSKEEEAPEEDSQRKESPKDKLSEEKPKEEPEKTDETEKTSDFEATKGDTKEFLPVREKEENLSETAELHTEILKYAAAPPERKMEELLRTEEDGQISLAIGEENILEKQITGQLTIGEILEAWEEKKRRAKEKAENPGEKKQAVLFETGEISNVLQDFIPRTPKDAVPMPETPVFREEPAAKPEPEPVSEPISELEVFTEPEIPSEPEASVTEPVVSMTELEDDLPQDIEEEEQEQKVSQNTASMLDAIERALAMEVVPIETSGAYLTEDQEKIFAYFTSVNGMKKQLIKLLSEDGTYAGMENSAIGNLIITGHPGNGKTTLAIDIVKAFQKQRQQKGGKLAKVSGDGLNKKNPEEVVKKLGGGALIIERAGVLSDDTVQKLSGAMEGKTDGLLVILEDDQKEIRRLMERNEGFARKFNRSIDIPIFSNDELVAFGKSYAEEQEYFFDEMAVLALYDSIGVRQTSDHVVNITEVKEFVDDAIEHAEKKSRGIFAKLSKKRIDEYGNKLLLEEDFEF